MEYEWEDEKGKVKRYEVSYSQVLERRLIWAVLYMASVGLALLIVGIVMIKRLDDMNALSILANCAQLAVTIK